MKETQRNRKERRTAFRKHLFTVRQDLCLAMRNEHDK
jgi:hypothetical protein